MNYRLPIRLFYVSLLFCLTQLEVIAQFQHQIYPALSGQALEQALVNGYKPATVLLYGEARDSMFKNVYLEKDSVVCIYSQHKVYLAPGTDPTQGVYLNGTPNGINTEHTYPQSKGASEANGNPHSDMHHLYPTRLAVNEARGNLIFKDIPDTQTSKWYFRDQTLTTAPAVGVRDQYSEISNSAFEVRESQKGNIARSMFYFFTMYRQEALTADPVFFESQRTTLCAWHYADPVDSLEYKRTFKIGTYQDNKANPFVLDCSLAARTYCTGASAGTCPMLPIVAVQEPGVEIKPILSIVENPCRGAVAVQLNLPKAQYITLTINDLEGKQARVLYDGYADEKWTQTFATEVRGMAVVSLVVKDGVVAREQVVVLD
jgi:Endonuclease I